MSASIILPVTATPFGKWLEEHGACVSFDCVMGNFEVKIGWKVVHRYSDSTRYESHWSVTRRNPDLLVALAEAMLAAQAEAAHWRKPPPPRPVTG